MTRQLISIIMIPIFIFMFCFDLPLVKQGEDSLWAMRIKKRNVKALKVRPRNVKKLGKLVNGNLDEVAGFQRGGIVKVQFKVDDIGTDIFNGIAICFKSRCQARVVLKGIKKNGNKVTLVKKTGRVYVGNNNFLFENNGKYVKYLLKIKPKYAKRQVRISEITPLYIYNDFSLNASKGILLSSPFEGFIDIEESNPYGKLHLVGGGFGSDFQFQIVDSLQGDVGIGFTMCQGDFNGNGITELMIASLSIDYDKIVDEVEKAMEEEEEEEEFEGDMPDNIEELIQGKIERYDVESGKIIPTGEIYNFPLQIPLVVKSGDVNGDGYHDVVVLFLNLPTEKKASEKRPGGGKDYDEGGDGPTIEIKVIRGSKLGLDLNTMVALEPPDMSPWSLITMQSFEVVDLDGDGISDVICGASDANKGSGAIYVYPGKENFSFDEVHAITSNSPDIGFGFCLAAGDFDGNNHTDLAIGSFTGGMDLLKSVAGEYGAYDEDEDRFTMPRFGDDDDDKDVKRDVKRVVTAPKTYGNIQFLHVYGDTDGLPSIPDEIISDTTSDLPLDNLGFLIKTAGDYNGDGADDLLLGTVKDFSPSIHLYLAGEKKEFVEVMASAYSLLGMMTMKAVGDVNNDGYDDFVIAQPRVWDYLRIIFGKGSVLVATGCEDPSLSINFVSIAEPETTEHDITVFGFNSI